MERIVWTMWWQGLENAPSIVNACIKSMYKYIKNVKIIVLNKDNYSDYVTVPEHIMFKFNEGYLSITHLSDVIRMLLLFQYGGLWLDSTILLTDQIPEEIWNRKFYTIGCQNDKTVAGGRWTTFLMGGQKNCIIFMYMNILFASYFENENEMVSYFLQDFFLNLIYQASEEARFLFGGGGMRNLMKFFI